MVGGWFMAWMTGHGSSVGPGIIRIGRVCGIPHWMLESMDGLPGSDAGRGQTLFVADEEEGAEVDEEPGAPAAGEEGGGAARVRGVEEERQPPADREEPEGDRDDALLLAFGGDPLHEEPHREECLPEEPHRQPERFGTHVL